ncbi:50S ribosomal protein L29 [Patescibacteria group bacterium]|nr:50S ribosomal protein L29 [Patescibacteria group bacterium]
MKLKEIRAKSVSDLQKLLAEKRETLRDIRFKVSQNQHKNYNELGVLKSDIAQILTVMKEMKLVDELSNKDSK